MLSAENRSADAGFVPRNRGKGKMSLEAVVDRRANTAPRVWDYIRPEVLVMPRPSGERSPGDAASGPGVISLESGETDLATPAFICEAADWALRQGRTFYATGRGIDPLRAAISDYHGRWHAADIGRDRVTVTSSGMSATMLVAQATLSRGDVAVVVTPTWPNVLRAVEIAGAEIVPVELTHQPDRGWSLDLDQLFAACGRRTRLIYFASPGNPTGWTVRPDQAIEIAAFARARKIAVLVDEVYHRVGGSDRAGSMLRAARPSDPVFVVNSFSKSYAMTGWRVGWLVHPPACGVAIENLVEANTCGGPEFTQHGALAALVHGEDFISEVNDHCGRGRDIVSNRLRAMPGVRVVEDANRVFTLFELAGLRDTHAFCRAALAGARVGLTPGGVFGAGSKSLVRLCHARAAATLAAAMDRLGEFVANGYPASHHRSLVGPTRDRWV